jgi:hypothetical protein
LPAARRRTSPAPARKRSPLPRSTASTGSACG